MALWISPFQNHQGSSAYPQISPVLHGQASRLGPVEAEALEEEVAPPSHLPHDLQGAVWVHGEVLDLPTPILDEARCRSVALQVWVTHM